jgi:hypothetical protein
VPVERPRSSRIAGSATLSIATSMPSMKIAPHSTNSKLHARASMRPLDVDMVEFLLGMISSLTHASS